MDVTNHWKYFLSLEAEVNNTLRYVEYTDEQKSVYSFEFSKLLLLICSELDVLFKVVCGSIDQSAGADSIGKYFDTISSKYDIASEEATIDLYSSRLNPFDNWSSQDSPEWWTAHNKIKHRRHTHFEMGNLGNVIQAISGLFVINLIALNEDRVLSKVYDRPLLLGRDKSPGHLMLEASYEIKLKNP